MFVMGLVTYAYSQNPICSNYDKSRSDYDGCFAYNATEFMEFFEYEPTFSDGMPYGEKGIVFWNEFKDDSENETQFVRDGITFSVLPKLQYSCEYEVFPSETLSEKFNMKYSDKKFAVKYSCEYKSNGKADTNFAVTEFQKFIEVEELLLKALTKDFTGFDVWKFYRRDGTLKFTGDMHGGFCMSANGMKKTKRVTSPKYCK